MIASVLVSDDLAHPLQRSYLIFRGGLWNTIVALINSIGINLLYTMLYHYICSGDIIIYCDYIIISRVIIYFCYVLKSLYTMVNSLYAINKSVYDVMSLLYTDILIMYCCSVITLCGSLSWFTLTNMPCLFRRNYCLFRFVLFSY